MSTALTLYTLEDNLAALLDSQDLVEDEQQQVEILREISAATDAAVIKRDNIIRMLRHLEFQQANIDAEVQRLVVLGSTYARAQERLEQYVIRIMDALVPAPKKGPKKLEGSIGVLVLKQNPPSVEISDELVIPERFMVQPPPPPPPPQRPDKAAIKKALQAGETVPGADLKIGGLRLEVK